VIGTGVNGIAICDAAATAAANPTIPNSVSRVESEFANGVRRREAVVVMSVHP
jgi:uncharacterized membrane protein YadS